MKKYYKHHHLVSKEVCKDIICYYYELYNNYEVKSPGEIGDELQYDRRTIYRFHELYLNNDDDKMSDIYMIIMLCTKFNVQSQYYQIQKETFGSLIEQRKQIHEAKEKRKQIIKMVQERSKEYMKKRQTTR